VVILERVTRAYRRGGEVFEAIAGVDLTIMPASLTAIVGPSGAGKSTLLHLIGALDRPTSGRVLLHGDDLARLRDSQLTLLRRRRIGFVFQFFNLLPGLQTWQNIAMPLLLDGVKPSRARERAVALAQRLGIGHSIDAPAGTLSGGEMQRAAMARALAHGPDLVLADEPTGSLDRKTGSELLRLMRGVVDEGGISIVMVTHDAAAAAIADRVIRIVDGHVTS
jgi:putative ABC transport system ATP-binding protein